MKMIVILPRGWVCLGDFSDDGTWGYLENAHVVRRWGTTKGLGELAKNGPTASTILDATPKQRFPLSAVINMIECDEKAWK